MIAVGIDLGGTKIAARIFDKNWTGVADRRLPTPPAYAALIADLANLVGWADRTAGFALPVGIGAAGLIDPATGLAYAANLPTHGKPIAADIAAAIGRPVALLNDSQAMGLSESVFGAGKPYRRVLALVLGTGVSGSFTDTGQVQTGPTHTGGEFGHIAAPAHLVAAHGLPIVACGCGQAGCIETLISGRGLVRIAETVMGRTLTPEQIVAARGNDAAAAKVWDIWCALTGDLIRTLTRTLDPDCIVLAGGLSKIAGVDTDLEQAARSVQFAGFGIAPILIAQGGDASGARGAAYAATMPSGGINA